MNCRGCDREFAPSQRTGKSSAALRVGDDGTISSGSRKRSRSPMTNAKIEGTATPSK